MPRTTPVISIPEAATCPLQPYFTKGLASGSPSTKPRLMNRCVVMASALIPSRPTPIRTRLEASQKEWTALGLYSGGFHEMDLPNPAYMPTVIWGLLLQLTHVSHVQMAECPYLMTRSAKSTLTCRRDRGEDSNSAPTLLAKKVLLA